MCMRNELKKQTEERLVDSTSSNESAVVTMKESSKKRISSKVAAIKSSSLKISCKICGDKSSGFHYGVHACEGCKSFFRRTIRMKLDYDVCDQICKIDIKNRNKCQYCRYKKCTEFGMSQKAVRFGRMPTEEKEFIIAGTTSPEYSTLISPTDLDRNLKLLCAIETLSISFSKSFSTPKDKVNRLWKAYKEQVDQAKSLHHLSDVFKTLHVLEEENRQSTSSMESTLISFTESTGPHVWEATAKSHQNKDVNVLKCRLSKALCSKMRRCAVISIAEICEFAKRIPHFSSLDIGDQVVLLKYGSHEALFTMLSVFVYDKGLYFPFVNIHATFRFMEELEMFGQYMKTKFRFAEKIAALQLSDVEMALFVSVIILSADRPGLLESKKIEKIQEEVLECLQFRLSLSHPHKPRLFACLLLILTELRQLVAEHVIMEKRLDEFHEETPPLIQEILRGFEY